MFQLLSTTRVALLLALLAGNTDQAVEQPRWSQGYLPNAPVVTQNGEALRFYDEVGARFGVRRSQRPRHEGANAGTDLVQTILNAYTLTTNVENLAFIGAGSFNGIGNAANNVITGGSGNDTLNGGAGSDTLVGGTGNDIYLVDNVDNVVTEAANAGTDLVQTTLATYTLSTNVENLTFTGAGNFNGTGNALNKFLTV